LRSLIFPIAFFAVAMKASEAKVYAASEHERL
jgi:hypothetical protein